MNPRQLQQLAQDLRGQSLAQIDQELHRRHLDPETRIAVKHQLQTLGPARPPRRLTAEGLAAASVARPSARRGRRAASPPRVWPPTRRRLDGRSAKPSASCGAPDWRRIGGTR